MKDFKKLKVWQEAMQLTRNVYELTNASLADDQYGLQADLRRLSAAVPATIAASCGYDADTDKARIIDTALSSTYELEVQLLVSIELGCIKEPETKDLIKQLNGLQRGMLSLSRKMHGGKTEVSVPQSA